MSVVLIISITLWLLLGVLFWYFIFQVTATYLKIGNWVLEWVWVIWQGYEGTRIAASGMATRWHAGIPCWNPNQIKSNLFLISTETTFTQIWSVYTHERSTRKAGGLSSWLPWTSDVSKVYNKAVFRLWKSDHSAKHILRNQTIMHHIWTQEAANMVEINALVNHRFSQVWQLRVCKWNFRMCKMPLLMKITMKMKKKIGYF